MTRASVGLLERIKDGSGHAALLADGAMGTVLYGLGVGFEQCFEGLCLSRPELVRSVHADYVAAGARLLETNSFGANRIRLAEHGLDDRVREINLAAAELARQAADAASESAWVAGSVGPLGQDLSPLGKLDEADARSSFEEQITAVAEGGVDLILIETMRALREALIALEAAKSSSDLPVWVQVSFGEDGLTSGGRSPEEVAEALEAAGADGIGANCSTGPAQMLAVIERMASVSDLPISAMPNAGLPAMVGGRYVYAASPAYMGEVAGKLVDAGARLVGGCCGTTAEHIRAMERALSEGNGAAAKPLSSLGPTVVRDLRPAGGDRENQGDAHRQRDVGLLGPTAFQARIAEGRAVSLEVRPPRGFDASPVLVGLQSLAERGLIDAFNVSDVPRARPRASALAMGALLQGSFGRPTMLTVGCRHRNLVALHADLLGAHALGMRDVVAVMGALPAQGDYPNATVVSDLSDLQLIELLAGFNAGVAPNGRPLDEPTAFHIGCRFSFHALDSEREAARFQAKVRAGAQFAISEPLYDPAAFDAFLEQLGGSFPVPVMIGLLPLRGLSHAAYLHNEVPGIEIPEPLIARLRAAGDADEAEGLAACAEIASRVLPHAAGLHLVTSGGRLDRVAPLLDAVIPDRGLAEVTAPSAALLSKGTEA